MEKEGLPCELEGLKAELEQTRAQLDWLRLQCKEHDWHPDPMPNLSEKGADQFLTISFRVLDTQMASVKKVPNKRMMTRVTVALFDE